MTGYCDPGAGGPDDWAAALRRQLAAVDGIVETTSRFGSSRRIAWRTDECEVAHLHAPPFVDVRLPGHAGSAVASDGRIVTRRSRSEWIECRMESPEDAAFVAALICRAALAAPRRRR